MPIVEIVAIFSLIGNLIQGFVTYLLSQRKDKISAEDTLRDDLFQVIKNQNEKIDKLNAMVDKQWTQIDELKEQRIKLTATIQEQTTIIDELKDQRVRIREEFTEVVKKTAQDVSNWRESYYMVMDQYQKLKIENEKITAELHELRKNYERLLAEYSKLTTNHS